MCGIAGYVDQQSGGDSSRLRRMCAALRHRGPDDEGVVLQGPAALGMRRLSIIDVAGGRQPIANEDETVWVVFNGEIYNFQALRKELEGRGHCFSTHSDTEVIVHLYEERGADCVHALRGMFAFAVWDTRLRKLLLARDRLGIKPLHYAFSLGCFYFGSEIKAILAVAPELAEVDPEAVTQFFQYQYIPDPATAYRRIRKLPPGHLLEFAGGEARVRRYWDLPRYGTLPPAPEEEVLEELEQRLTEAVRLRMISEVPLGAFLSGGVDSSVVVALMARASSRPVQTFTLGFAHGEFNEAGYARQVAERFGTEHHELRAEADFQTTLARLTAQFEEPFASAQLNNFLVAELARREVTVALSGDGGDEIFAGYERYQSFLQRERYRHLPKELGRWYRTGVFPRLPHALPGRNFLYHVSLRGGERYFDDVAFLGIEGRNRSMFSDGFLDSVRNLKPPLEVFREHWRQAPADTDLERMMYLDTKTYLPADCLTKVDRTSMAVSLEARVPLLDHELVEWATALPLSWKLRGGQGKYLLRRLAEKLGVPRAVLDRPKQGFDMPLKHWARGELKQELNQLLLEPRTLQRGYFKPAAVRQMLQEHFRGRRNHSGIIWQMIIFELWHRNFPDAVGAGAAAPAVVGAAGEAR